MSNLDTWNKVCRPPASALKTIGGGRLKGMTDINPQWRLQAITEIYGECGVGWYYEIDKMWTETYESSGELMCFVTINLHTKQKDGWSAPIQGIGGSGLIQKESAGLRVNDEAYKMATTDALSVAMKQLGFGAEVYMGRWDGSKYKDEPNHITKPTVDVSFKPDGDQVTFMLSVVDSIVSNKADIPKCVDLFYQSKLDNEEKVWIWDKLQPHSALRAAMKKLHEANKTKETA